MSVAAPVMMRDLEWSEMQLDLIFGAFAWAYALGPVPGEVIGDRFGPRCALTVVSIARFATTALKASVPRALPVRCQSRRGEDHCRTS